MIKRVAMVAVLITALLAGACSKGDKEMADLVLINGAVHTMDPALSVAEAIAVRDGRILRVGSSADIRALAGPGTRVVDLSGPRSFPASSTATPISSAAGSRFRAFSSGTSGAARSSSPGSPPRPGSSGRANGS